MKLKMLLMIVLIVSVLLVGCTQEKDIGDVDKITVSNSEEYSTLIWIAEEQGFFEKNNLDVTNNDYQSGKQAADVLIADEADISISAEFVLVSNSFNHPELRALATVDKVNNVEIIARRGNGVLSLNDLEGKKIGVTKKSVGEFFIGLLLEFNGISIDAVEIVDLNPRDMLDSLLNGEVDAVLTWAPNTFNIKKSLGDNAISWSGQAGQEYNMILLSKEEFIEDNKDAITRFLRAIIEAEEYVNNNNAAAKDFIAKKYTYDSSYINDAWPKHNFEVELSQKLIVLMEDQARWRIENGLSDAAEVPNYLDYIYLDALDEVKPEAVGVID